MQQPPHRTPGLVQDHCTQYSSCKIPFHTLHNMQSWYLERTSSFPLSCQLMLPSKSSSFDNRTTISHPTHRPPATKFDTFSRDGEHHPVICTANIKLTSSRTDIDWGIPYKSGVSHDVSMHQRISTLSNSRLHCSWCLPVHTVSCFMRSDTK